MQKARGGGNEAVHKAAVPLVLRGCVSPPLPAPLPLLVSVALCCSA